MQSSLIGVNCTVLCVYVNRSGTRKCIAGSLIDTDDYIRVMSEPAEGGAREQVRSSPCNGCWTREKRCLATINGTHRAVTTSTLTGFKRFAQMEFNFDRSCLVDATPEWLVVFQTSEMYGVDVTLMILIEISCLFDGFILFFIDPIEIIFIESCLYRYCKHAIWWFF